MDKALSDVTTFAEMGVGDIKSSKTSVNVYNSYDFLTLQANLVNNCGRPLAVDWRVQWLDADGVEIDSAVCSWNARMLQPHEICALKGTAPRADAADMRIYIRQSVR